CCRGDLRTRRIPLLSKGVSVNNPGSLSVRRKSDESVAPSSQRLQRLHRAVVESLEGRRLLSGGVPPHIIYSSVHEGSVHRGQSWSIVVEFDQPIRTLDVSDFALTRTIANAPTIRPVEWVYRPDVRRLTMTYSSLAVGSYRFRLLS